MLIVKQESCKAEKFKVIGLAQLELKPECTAPKAYAMFHCRLPHLLSSRFFQIFFCGNEAVEIEQVDENEIKENTSKFLQKSLSKWAAGACVIVLL